jgi:hypothetical protein
MRGRSLSVQRPVSMMARCRGAHRWSRALHPDPFPPNPLKVVERDEQLAATPTNLGHLALPDGLSQLDRADAELGGGVRQAERGGGYVATREFDWLHLLRARRAATVHIAQVVRVFAVRDSGLAAGLIR